MVYPSLDFFPVGHIDPVKPRARTKLFEQGFTRCLVYIAEYNAGAFFCEAQRSGLTDPGRAAGD
jgi:hypothetical protein